MAARAALALGVLAALLALLTAFAPARAHAQEPGDTVFRLDSLRVSVARLEADGVPLARLPFGAQVIPAGEAGTGIRTVADVLAGAVGVSTASQFGSSAQPDVRLRGFQVGPVVGFPQSVSVFVDGVRVNEPDASQVNFDLIPLHAVERVEVIRSPGGPFGRNALAGAINVVTRRGDAGEGLSGMAALGGGSFGTGEAHGLLSGGLGGVDYLLSGRYLQSEGWRDLSATTLRQAYGKLGYRGEATDVWASYTFADNRLEGPGSLPRSWLAGMLPPSLAGTDDPRRLQFTGFEGDWFDPRLHFATLHAAHRLGERTRLLANTFLRSNRFTQFNDNITEPNARGETDLLSAGAAAQVVRSLSSSGGTFSAGLEYVRNDTDIQIFEVANPAFPEAGGRTESVASVEDNAAAFAHLWWPLSRRSSLTAALRYDYVFLPVTDRLDPENSGENTFRQLTGSVGGDLLITEGLRAFAGYGRGFRAPVILEVSCADPEDPCPLPFELGADPPLDPVTTDTWQAGVRWTGASAATVELVGYWAEVHDDLFAVVAPPSTRGYFKNLDRTRRQGLELAAAVAPLPDLAVRASAGLVRATFQSRATLASALLDDDDEAPGEPDPPAGEPGEGGVQVEPDNHFAMVPNVTAGVGVLYSPGPWSLGLDGAFVGSQYFLGDEWNREEFGRLPSYFVLDGRVARSLADFDLFLEGSNLLDSDHSTFGILSPNIRGPVEEPQPFLSPALPFHVEAGIRYSF